MPTYYIKVQFEITTLNMDLNASTQYTQVIIMKPIMQPAIFQIVKRKRVEANYFGDEK